MATIVQHAASSEANPAVATLAAGPTQGNLLVVCATERSGGLGSDFTIDGTGWTKTIAREVTDATTRRSLAIWWKVAGASEPSAVSIDNGTANAILATIAEFEHEGAEDEFELIGSASNDNNTTQDATSLATGTTGSLTGEEKFLVAVMAMKRKDDGNVITTAWATETLTAAFGYGSVAFGRHISLGYANSDADGTKASTGTISGTSTLNNGLMAGILAFRVKSAGGDGLTVSVAESLNNWLDAFLSNLEYRITSADDLNNWLENNLNTLGYLLANSDSLNEWLDSFASSSFGFITFAASDDLNEWLDGTANTLVGSLVVSITGNLDNWGDTQAFQYEYRIPITDQLVLSDDLVLRKAYLIHLVDDLANYLDSVSRSLSGGAGSSEQYKDLSLKISIDIGI